MPQPPIELVALFDGAQRIPAPCSGNDLCFDPSELNDWNQDLISFTTVIQLAHQPQSEANLRAFVLWLLALSRSDRYSLHERLEILDCAWHLQKQVWQIRNAQLQG